MEAKALFRRELAALKSIDDYFVDTDYWQDETIRLYRGLGLVWTDGQRINLTEAGMQAIGRTLPAAQRRRVPLSPRGEPGGLRGGAAPCADTGRGARPRVHRQSSASPAQKS